jgi:hypothetical protein
MTPKQKILYGIAAAALIVIISIIIWASIKISEVNSKPELTPADKEERKGYIWWLVGAIVGTAVPFMTFIMAS